MKSLPTSILVASMMVSGAALAKDKPADKNAPLNKALASVAAAATASGPPAKTVDKDQGDDRANLGAILKVCGKDTPAARRAAICPVGGSPE